MKTRTLPLADRWLPVSRALATALGAGLIVAGSASAQSLPAEEWWKNPLLQGAQLSPDGQHLAAVYSDGDKQIVVVRRVDGGEIKPVAVMQDDELRYRWLRWANDERIFVSLIARNPTIANRPGVKSNRSRLFGVDRDGGNAGFLGRKWPTEQVYNQGKMVWLPPQIQDEVLHYLPGDPKNVLIQFREVTEEFPSVKRMSVASGKLKTALRRKQGIHDYLADHEGKIRYGWGFAKESVSQGYLRTSTKEKWQTFDAEIYDFAGFAFDPKLAYVWKKKNGRSALYEWNILGNEPTREIWSHPEYDGDGIVFDRARGLLVGVEYVADRRRIHYFDDFRRKLHARVESEYPDASIDFVSWSRDGKRAIARVSGPQFGPRYLDVQVTKTGTAVDTLFTSYPWLEEVTLAPSKEVRFEARDGLEIPAILTVPYGAKAKNLPTIVLVHGGPFGVRDSVAFDREVQFLASRGYAVFQINFRGSGGYGEEFKRAGYGEFGEAMQHDLADGARWLIAKGVADPKRVGIYGGSYGGYAAMMGLIQEPELFRAGASYAGVMDLRTQEKAEGHYLYSEYWPKRRVDLTRGSLSDYSPIEHAAKIAAPVLLAHGENDSVVHPKHSRAMNRALKRADKDVEFLEFPNEIHGFLLESNRVRFYEALERFFEENLKNAT